MVYNNCVINTNFFIRRNLFLFFYTTLLVNFSCRITMRYFGKQIVIHGINNKHLILCQIDEKTRSTRERISRSLHNSYSI